METLIFQSDNHEKLDALKAFARSLDIYFETEEKPYDPEFVAKIQESRRQFENGQHKVIDIEDLWK
ncbi:DUF2683 family protein [Dyadobacter sp. CY356]|uniref:DUF2683 family protein n=1 Tax=Dyadobacter sp. CY356 TaxID=2906442 RepID=UPI001F415765|nr:DUF2683 family protein [Dyadobacter sp. CY356]MCF0057631.1 hypothetical protein [Dyadobacter sp. CY356]